MNLASAWVRLGRLGLLALSSILLAGSAAAQEIPLEYCDRLPAIQVQVVGQKSMLFLVDTAASSLLNLQSFVLGESKEVEIASYRGISTASARLVNLPEVEIGGYRLVGLKMLAVDLSALSANCGRRIDGILGADLLEKMGATIDFKRKIARFASSDDRRNDERIVEINRDLRLCLVAFNAADEKTLAGCFDPKVALLTPNAEIYGREQALAYLRERYFHPRPEARIKVHPSAFRSIGEVAWFEYDLSLTVAGDSLHARGLAMCRKSEGHWRILSMNHSIDQPEISAAK